MLASAEARADDKSHVLDALGNVASEMRRKLGESLSTVQKYNTPLEQATTPSLEALQAYSLGIKTFAGGDNAEALPFFQRATQLDPNFAKAFWAMANSYANVGETALSAETIRKAFALRTEVSASERLVIEGDYNYYATGNLVKARRNCELAAQTYPRADFFHNQLGSFANAFGQYEIGLKEYREALRLAPYSSYDHRNVVYTDLLLNQVEDAVAAAIEMHTKGLDSNLAPVLYGIAFYREDIGEMARQVASAAGKPGEEDMLLALEADTAAYFGHLGRELRGSGSSTTDASIPDGRLAWSSDKDGVLGTGHDLLTRLSVNTHRIKLVATDSLGRTGSAAITVNVTAGNDVPTAQILQPADYAFVGVNQPFVLVGKGTDPVDGVLPDAVLTWSDSSGQLGTGRTLTVKLPGPSCGPLMDMITLTVRNKAGKTAQTSIRVYIGPVC